MEIDWHFVYKKEVWYISAIINTKKIDIKKKIIEIEDLIKEKVNNLIENDLEKIKWNKSLMKQVIECGKNMSITCEWVSYIDYFPYYHENLGLKFNMLGYFRFDIEYFYRKEDAPKMESIPPELIQQIPTIILEIIKEFCGKYVNQCLCIDCKSPIYIFVASNKIKDNNNKMIKIKWSEEEIKKYKKIIGKWTEIYSGQWPDYSDSLYTKRTENNLSNRLSELHYIGRNSGFIYMEEENFNNFFESYMIKYVLEPTAQVRSILFALTSINESIDILFSMLDFLSIEIIEEKINNLRNLRGMIQTKLSIIYNELDYNRRQHYTSVLNHLIKSFNLNRILDRINNKFDVIHDSMETRYQKKNEENHTRMEHGMNYLNILFAIMVIVEVTDFLMTAISGKDLFRTVFNSIILIIITLILLLVIRSFSDMWIQSGTKVRKTVDAVIIDGKDVLLIKRKFPPFKDQYALPGGFIEKGESPKIAVIREAKEETGLKIKVVEKIGFYDDPERDPRGRVVSTAFLCSIIGDKILKKSDETTDLKFIPLEELKGVDLAFDHEFILKDAIKILAGKGLKDVKLALDFGKILEDVP